MLRLLLAATAALAVVLWGSGQAGAESLIGFTSPSGNIGCYVDAAYVRCDIAERDWAPPPRPADCEFDYGQGIAFAPGEAPGFVCAGDTTLWAGDSLSFGQTVEVGPMLCTSLESGVTCHDTVTGAGFTISREEYALF